MLQEDRFLKIREILESMGSVTIADLQKRLGLSESTVRRDLEEMDERGLITKVRGGAIAKALSVLTTDVLLEKRMELNLESKKRIAEYAASLIVPGDLVFLDAGSTTLCMTDFITEKNAVYVTNGVEHGRNLVRHGFRTFIIGGALKPETGACVGEEAVANIEKYNFTKGFFGSNGVTKKNGYTTPEMREAMLKKKAMEHSKERFVLADESKVGKISSICFGDFGNSTLLTTAKRKDFKDINVVNL